MSYMCIKGRGECDCCKDCAPKNVCEECGNESTSLIETEYGFICEKCFDLIIIEEEN